MYKPTMDVDMRAQRKTSKFIQDEGGMATVEALPLLIVFVVFFAYSLGSFGLIHTGVLNSIAARSYAFEIFRHRTNLTYLRGNNIDPTRVYYNKKGNRIHVVMSERGAADQNRFPATERRIAMGLDTDLSNRDSTTVHNEAVYSIQEGVQNATIEANPAWVMTQYGICLDAGCGGD